MTYPGKSSRNTGCPGKQPAHPAVPEFRVLLSAVFLIKMRVFCPQMRAFLYALADAHPGRPQIDKWYIDTYNTDM